MRSGTQLLTEREIEEKVIDLVARARKRYWIAKRCRGHEACTAIGLRSVRGHLPPGMDGMLTPDGKIIVSDAIEWMSRAEFTVFHEIVHFLLDEDGELIDFFTETHRSRPQDYDRAIERCCQMGPAEFMMPRSRVQATVAEHGFSVDLVERLAGINGASILAASVQLARCAPVDCYVAVCRYGISPLWPHNRGLHVEHAAMRAGMRYPWRRGTAIPVDHLFYQVWEGKLPLSGPSSVPFRSGKRYACEYGEAKMVSGQIVGILYLGHSPRRGQLGLNL